MDLLVFVLTYILITIIFYIFFVGIILLFILIIKITFKMNETKWTSFFSYRKGIGYYIVLAFPYLLTVLIMFPLSKFWFELINFEYKALGSLTIVVLLTLFGMFKFSKLKNMIREKVI